MQVVDKQIGVYLDQSRLRARVRELSRRSGIAEHEAAPLAHSDALQACSTTSAAAGRHIPVAVKPWEEYRIACSRSAR